MPDDWNLADLLTSAQDDQADASTREFAASLRRHFTALVAVGFTAEQALTLVQGYQQTIFTVAFLRGQRGPQP